MKQSFSYDPTEPLSHIDKVEAPPFLLTRIKEKAREAYRQRVSPAVAWASCALVAVVLGVNAWVMTTVQKRSEERTISAVQGHTDFFPDNSLYE